MPLRLALLGCLAVLGSGGCSLLLDGDALTRGSGSGRGGGGGSGGGATGQSGTGAAGQGAAGTAGQGSAGTAGQSGGEGGQGTGGECATAGDTCDGRGSDCELTLDEPSCPMGCDGIELTGTPYMACTEGATFNDAEVLCQAQGMHLVRIDDEAENNVTVDLARTLGSYVWIGGSSLAEVGSYAWADGTEFFRDGAAIDGVYQNFEPGQPVEGVGRNCVHLHNSAEGPWSNAPCSDVKPYVCERF